jgi:hypothetical protein
VEKFEKNAKLVLMCCEQTRIMPVYVSGLLFFSWALTGDKRKIIPFFPVLPYVLYQDVGISFPSIEKKYINAASALDLL